MKLAAGEPPARGGYPACVFDSLPRLLERPGPTLKGSITAFYTVLLEGEDESDPLGDEIRSILDGHYLSESQTRWARSLSGNKCSKKCESSIWSGH